MNWNGPCRLPTFGHNFPAYRTDYLVSSSSTCMVSATLGDQDATVTPKKTREQVYVLAPVNGGVTWARGARVSREVSPISGSLQIDSAIMPATVRLSPTKLVCCIRNLLAYPKNSWIDCMESTDNGATWSKISQPVGNEAGTTPPALNRLAGESRRLDLGRP